MRVLITTQVFPPEIHPTARIVWELARSLSDAGNDVTVAGGYPHHPHGRILGGYRKKRILRETVGGIRVVRGWHITSPSPSIPVRGAVYVSQAIGTILAVRTSPRPDVVINFGPPLVGPAASALLAGRFGARHVPVIYDLYPDVAIETGAMRNGALIRAAKALERWVYRRSDRIVVLSEGFRRTLVETKGVPAEKIRVIPVWIDTGEIRRVDGAGWREQHGIPAEAFVVLYAGTIGLVSGADVLVEVAEGWASKGDVLFLFVGEGKMKERIEAKAGRMENVRFLNFQPREELPRMLSSADVGVVTLLPGRARSSVPSKMLGYMAAEVPVIASCDPGSDSAQIVREAGCGIVVQPSDPVAISDALRKFRADTDFRREAGKRGRVHVERFHSLDGGTKAFRTLIEEVSGEPASVG